MIVLAIAPPLLAAVIIAAVTYPEFLLITLALIHATIPTEVFGVWLAVKSRPDSVRMMAVVGATALLLGSFILMPFIDTRRHLGMELYAGLCLWVPQLLVVLFLASGLSSKPA